MVLRWPRPLLVNSLAPLPVVSPCLMQAACRADAPPR